MKRYTFPAFASASLALACGNALAHGFGQRFTLPLPFWLYGGGACGALALSFLVLLWRRPVAQSAENIHAQHHVGASTLCESSQAAAQHAAEYRGLQDAKQFSAVAILWLAVNPALMLLAIVSGWFGSQHAASNFSMTWFWIYFLLAFFYLAALSGRRYKLLNPWWCATALLMLLRTTRRTQNVDGAMDTPHHFVPISQTQSDTNAALNEAGQQVTHHDPCQPIKKSVTQAGNSGNLLAVFSAWPAFAGYMLLIELELFGHASPQRLSVFLAAYTALWLFVCVSAGSSTWFRQFDTFHALFEHASRLRAGSHSQIIEAGSSNTSKSLTAGFSHISLTADATADPAQQTASASSKPEKLETAAAETQPTAALRSTHPLLSPISVAAQMLICAMLASTAFDALRESVPWATELWKLLLTLFPQNSTNPLAILAALSGTYRQAEMIVWLLMPIVYFALMAVMVAASRAAAPVSHSFSYDMSLAALALLPLVLGYHVAHYFPLILSEGPNLVHLLSDPLGEGWNLLGTASMLRAPIMLETDTVWHLQVALIVLGHLGGVLVSHWQACQIHATQRAVLLSQLPMLLWMMGLTTWGLWILSQPMKAG